MSNLSSGEPVRYQMHQQLISLGEDYDIEDAQGRPAFHVDGKLLRIRETFVITDEHGREVVTVKQKHLTLHETMTVERGGETIASVSKAFLSFPGDKFTIDVKEGQDLVAQGDFLEHNYTIRRGGDVVARISKAWFALRDTYGIEVEPGEDTGLILGVAVIIDELTHDKHEHH